MGTIYEEIGVRRAGILKAWQAQLASGPQTLCPSASRGAGRFANPVAYVAGECAKDTLAWLVDGRSAEDAPGSLGDWCRLRAVQETSPSRALRPILDLKRIVRDAVGTRGDADGLAAFDERIDEIALLAFDRYAESREKLFQVRRDEMRRGEGIVNSRQARDRARLEGDGR
ncbi:RsbRD N-terminal domain-containing protein [Rubneribacter badeniensis]|uniref:RsbRD N-terminal domain-containing protein n=1 Tax=Rubneribacter badeniensis TaxID=2070688 RepID=UPI003A94D899